MAGDHLAERPRLALDKVDCGRFDFGSGNYLAHRRDHVVQRNALDSSGPGDADRH